MLSPSEISALVEYDAKSGTIKWKPRNPSYFKDSGGHGPEWSANNWNAAHAGKEAGSWRPDGYRQINIGRKPYRAHRVAWAIYYGEWPAEQIDHIDGDRANNRIKNLREATNMQNAMNAARPKNNTSGVAGVSFEKNRWKAYITRHRKKIHLGSFETKNEAVAARNAAKITYGFSERHGV